MGEAQTGVSYWAEFDRAGGSSPTGAQVMDSSPDRCCYAVFGEVGLDEPLWVGRGGELDTGDIPSVLGDTGPRYGLEVRFDRDVVDLRLASLGMGSARVVIGTIHAAHAQELVPWPKDVQDGRPGPDDFRRHPKVRIHSRILVIEFAELSCTLALSWVPIFHEVDPGRRRVRSPVPETPQIRWKRTNPGFPDGIKGLHNYTLHFMVVMDVIDRLDPTRELTPGDRAKILAALTRDEAIAVRATDLPWTVEKVRAKRADAIECYRSATGQESFGPFAGYLHLPIASITHGSASVIDAARKATVARLDEVRAERAEKGQIRGRHPSR